MLKKLIGMFQKRNEFLDWNEFVKQQSQREGLKFMSRTTLQSCQNVWEKFSHRIFSRGEMR